MTFSLADVDVYKIDSSVPHLDIPYIEISWLADLDNKFVAVSKTASLQLGNSLADEDADVQAAVNSGITDILKLFVETGRHNLCRSKMSFIIHQADKLVGRVKRSFEEDSDGEQEKYDYSTDEETDQVLNKSSPPHSNDSRACFNTF
jgi:hypothetical protein